MPASVQPFNGAKLLLMHEGCLVALLRDDRPDIPYPAHWDLPGGGREGRETPIACALRELDEELALRLPPNRLTGHVFPSRQQPGAVSWLFVGAIRPDELATARLGNEGQGWRLMPVAEFLNHPLAVPHFRDWVRVALSRQGTGCFASQSGVFPVWRRNL